MAEVTVSGIRFHVQRLPAHCPTESMEDSTHPPTIVFVHGLLIDNMSSFYYTLANPVARAGADVILYDLRGHGGTERPSTGYSMAASVRDLAALLDVIGVTRPVHLVGNSFGGTVALALAIAHPDRVASLLLIEASVMTEDWIEQVAHALARGLQREGADHVAWRTEHGRKVYRLWATIDGLVNGTTLAADLRATRPFSSADLRSVTCPVAAAYGENSDIIGDAHTLKRLLPNCNLTVVPNCSHSLLVEAPSVVRDLLLRWLPPNAAAERMPVEKAPIR